MHLLQKEALSEGAQPWQDAALLTKLRNELLHYRSEFETEVGRKKVFGSLRGLNLAKPPFVSEHSDFFPHQLLGAECAAWSVRTAVAFINGFYKKLGVRSPLHAHMYEFDDL